MEAINACPHHGYAMWMLVENFYEGLILDHKRLVESMCNGSFLTKNGDEAMAYLNQVVEISKEWEMSQMNETGRTRPHSRSRGCMNQLDEDMA